MNTAAQPLPQLAEIQQLPEAERHAAYVQFILEDTDYDNQSEDIQWHLRRRLGIGGSDLAAILGLDPYRQAYDVWLEKTGRELPRDLDSENVFWGNEYEEPIAKEYCRRMKERTGEDFKVRNKNMPAVHKEHPFLLANIDRDIVGMRRGLEIKNVGWRMAPLWGEDGTDEAAEYYIPQPHHYMLCMDYQEWDLAALIGGQELRIYHFERDPEMDQIIIDTCRDFWFENVIADHPPEIDLEHKRVGDLLKRAYKTISGDVVELDSSAEAWHATLEEAKQQVKYYQGVVDGAKHHLLHIIGDNAGGAFSDGSGYTRKTVKRSGFTVEPTEYVGFRYTKKLPISK
ncbi:YqaJ viral recombinase family nuclease [Gilvimarinus sp. 1_MG-2023]|uniref:YqaJ viral recombinase family nuclease n=1 Tax=Gilvimarinus sp. 1_MG-2023 TaxID=3062638 RepID=UPI0026E37C43|nr:YqaJ viral recombinase family protein [Gilvimarinus sp. 1_MG-2023]MDO6747173.1 YqaJ viral recombinase family protein [Gilvimarinus sp. 1_MG-2023]